MWSETGVDFFLALEDAVEVSARLSDLDLLRINVVVLAPVSRVQCTKKLVDKLDLVAFPTIRSVKLDLCLKIFKLGIVTRQVSLPAMVYRPNAEDSVGVRQFGENHTAQVRPVHESALLFVEAVLVEPKSIAHRLR
jgi:hypothetical protein